MGNSSKEEKTQEKEVKESRPRELGLGKSTKVAVEMRRQGTEKTDA